MYLDSTEPHRTVNRNMFRIYTEPHRTISRTDLRCTVMMVTWCVDVTYFVVSVVQPVHSHNLPQQSCQWTHSQHRIRSGDHVSLGVILCVCVCVCVHIRLSIAFRHLPPDSARFSYATEGALFISMQLSSDAEGRKVRANSKHWFTTSFLQPLPYLVTP